MATWDEVYAAVAEMVAAKFGVTREEVTPDKRFLSDFGADSLDATELLLEAEDRFEIEVDVDDIAKWVTVRDACDYILKTIP